MQQFYIMSISFKLIEVMRFLAIADKKYTFS